MPKLGKDVTVEPFTSVYGDVNRRWQLDRAQRSVVGWRAHRSQLPHLPGAVISAIPQDLKFAGEKTTAEVGDGSTIRECVTINRGTADR